MSPADRRGTANRPPRPQNSFMLFRKFMLSTGELLVAGETKVKAQTMSKRIGHAWKNASEDVRRDFERHAEEERAAHRVKYPAYRYHPRSAAEIAWEKEEKQRQREERKSIRQLQRKRANSKARLSKSDHADKAPSTSSHALFTELPQIQAPSLPRLLQQYECQHAPSPSLSLASSPSSTLLSQIPITPSGEHSHIELNTSSPGLSSFLSPLYPLNHALSFEFGPDSFYSSEGKFLEAPLRDPFNDFNLPHNIQHSGYSDVDPSMCSSLLDLPTFAFNPCIYADMLSSVPSYGFQPAYESGASLPLQEDGFTSDAFHGSEGQFAFDASASASMSLSMLLQSMAEPEQSTSQPHWTSYGPDGYPPQAPAPGYFD